MKNSADTDGKAFVIWYNNIPEEACIELLTHDWQVSGLVAANSDTTGSGQEIITKLPATPEVAVNFCADIVEGGDLAFYFDIDWEWYSEGYTVYE